MCLITADSCWPKCLDCVRGCTAPVLQPMISCSICRIVSALTKVGRGEQMYSPCPGFNVLIIRLFLRRCGAPAALLPGQHE